jgi:hypothetical protein
LKSHDNLTRIPTAGVGSASRQMVETAFISRKSRDADVKEQTREQHSRWAFFGDDSFPALESFATHTDAALSIFLHPELIHAGERTRPFPLEGMPPIEIAHETIAAEDTPIMLHDPRREFETDEFQIVLG